MEQTLKTVMAQSTLPVRWTIVDDGSTDQTPEILTQWAQDHACINVITRNDRGRRSVGPGVIDAFYTGLEGEDLSQYDYICKLDMDLALPSGYFASLIKRMDQDPRLGSISGCTYYVDRATGRRVEERIGKHTSIGASKFLRTACFRQIGGFDRRQMWDGIDCYRARMLGWKAGSFDDDGLWFEHLRPMGSSDRSILRGRARHGRGQWELGSGALFVMASAAYRIGEAPRFIGSLAMLWGYFSAMATRQPKHPDVELRRFVRHFQRAVLRYGTVEAAHRIEAEFAPKFDPDRSCPPLAVATAPEPQRESPKPAPASAKGSSA